MDGSDSDGPPPLVDDSGDSGYGDFTKDRHGNPLDESSSSSGTSEGPLEWAWLAGHMVLIGAIKAYLQRVHNRTAARD